MAQAQIDSSCRFLTAVENCKRTDYNPILFVPQEIRDLDPDWKNCDTYFRGFYDPPLALLSVDALSGPTATGSSQSSSHAAVPFPTPQILAPMAVQTATTDAAAPPDNPIPSEPAPNVVLVL